MTGGWRRQVNKFGDHRRPVVVRSLRQVHDGFFTIDPRRLLRRAGELAGRKGVTFKAAMRPLLVETDDGLVLVDTGMPAVPPAVADLHERVGEPRLTAELARLGFSTEDVTCLIVTHLHYDHAGNVDLFANADRFIQADHLDFARDCPEPWPLGFADDAWRRVEWTEVPGEREVTPGVTVVPTPGHVPGHQSVLIERPDGERPAVFPGDAAPLPRNLEQGVLPGILFDEEEARKSLEWLRGLDADPYFYHAPEEMDVAGAWTRGQGDEGTDRGDR